MTESIRCKERPTFEPGELISSEDGAFAFTILELVGEGKYGLTLIVVPKVCHHIFYFLDVVLYTRVKVCVTRLNLL